jgi:hypothetical protein
MGDAAIIAEHGWTGLPPLGRAGNERGWSESWGLNL